VDFAMLQFSRVDWRKGIVVLAVLGGLGGVVFGVWVWKQAKARDPLAHLPPALNQPARTNAGDTLPLPAPPSRRQ